MVPAHLCSNTITKLYAKQAVRSTIMEGCRSGRTGTVGNRVKARVFPGFESPSLLAGQTTEQTTEVETQSAKAELEATADY